MKLAFSLMKSKSVWGVFVAVVAWLLSPEVLALMPETIAHVLQGVGAFLAAIGFRNAIAVNGAAATPDEAREANG